MSNVLNIARVFWGRRAVLHRILRSWAQVAPLLASLIAPITSLLDIPALTQHWYSRYGVPQPDFTASIVLSAIGLAFNIIANILLVLRFSVTASYWKLATQLSLFCWVIKTTIAVTNLIAFGVFSRNSPGFQYDEGFWCAVVSVIGSGIISCLLLFHYIFRREYGGEESKKIRISGRHFMLSIISLTSLLGLESFIFSRVEGWTYLDGIYFSVVTMLTIGFGDFMPTKTSTKILLFPIAVLAIAQLANQVGMIIGFFSQRSQTRRTNWRQRYLALQNAQKPFQDPEYNPDGNLKLEIDFLLEQGKREENMSEAYDLGFSLITLITFWLAGAAIFSSIENWTYGNGVYFCYIFFLTIGFGDFAPITPAGRVIFIVYSLMAVPIVASFAVQTVTKILETCSKRRLTKRKDAKISKDHKKKYISHSELVLREHRTLDEVKASSLKSNSRYMSKHQAADRTEEGSSQGPESHPVLENQLTIESPIGMKDDISVKTSPEDSTSEIAGEAALKDIDRLLVKRVLQLAVELETQARILLLHALPKGSPAELLLRADLRLQNRELRKLDLEDWKTKMKPEGLVDVNEPESGDVDVDERVRRYRQLFAAMLAAGSHLQKLEGLEQLVWERRREREQHVAGGESDQEPEGRMRLSRSMP